MKNRICVTCGTQYTIHEYETDHCPICEDERQYVPPGGQQWTNLEELQKKHKLIFHQIEENLYGIGMAPNFAIGQRALLIITPEGNLLWDCISLVNDAAIAIINALGGLDAIAISHPHYYSSMIEWSKAFGDIPVYLHENDRQWVQREGDTIHFWSGDSKKVTDDLTLYNAGGHFDGGTILHWPEGAGGKGALLTGDIIQVVADRKHVSFMYSYPNDIPLNEQAVTRITDLVEPLSYERIYGAWWGRNILKGAKEAVQDSAKRYIEAVT
jgi:glyoxylase-like metal-dependent hydrolase (beta-lactamase superfamily II)